MDGAAGLVNTINIQGVAFSVIASVLALATMGVPRFSELTELVVVAVLILLLGVPHGALDTVFARELYNIRTSRGWLVWAFAYLLPVILVVSLWHASPLIFLALFLTASVAHFSGDPAAGTPLITRILYGGAIIVLPAFRHASDLVRLFSFLTDPAAAATVVSCLQTLALPWLLAVTAALVASAFRSYWLTVLEIASVALLAVLAPPLLAFTIFFCGMHSARHILRTIQYSGRSSPRFLFGACVGPMLAVLVVSGFASAWLRQVPVEARVVQIVFVGLAALTVPHMALVERVRFSGWVKRAAGS